MKTSLTSFVLALILFLPVSSLNAQDRKVDFNSNQGEFEINAGYGIATLPDFINIFSSVLGAALVPGAVERIDGKGLGNYFIQLNYYLTDRMAVGLEMSYAQYQTTFIMNSGGSNAYQSKYITPMILGKYNWLNRPSFKMYSSAAAGLSLYTGVGETSGNSKESHLGFQLTPIGIRAGNKVAFFAELGFGYQGMVAGGISVKF